jgi:osmoprotectant transport system substrate-binding protein
VAHRSLWFALVAILAACSSPQPVDPVMDPGALRVAAFDFPESQIIAELYALALEGRGVAVDRLGPVGPREVVAVGMEAGHIDLVPEYLGSLYGYLGGPDRPDAGSLRSRLQRRGLVPLASARASNTNAAVIARPLAELWDVRTLSELALSGRRVRLGGPAECPERPFCLPGLRDAYGLTVREFTALGSSAEVAEALRLGLVDVGVMFTTDAALADPGLVALTDDRELQPPENVVPVMRGEALDRWGPVAREAVEMISEALTTEDLIELNASVAEGSSPAEAAAAWLAQIDAGGDG